MRRDVQEIFRSTAQTKQVMMFSATLSKEIRPVCKKFMHDVITTLYIQLMLCNCVCISWLHYFLEFFVLVKIHQPPVELSSIN